MSRKRIRVASHDSERPRGSELRIERREFGGLQNWLVVLNIKRLCGALDTHTIKAAEPCSILTIYAIAERSIEELAAVNPVAGHVRMEFFA